MLNPDVNGAICGANAAIFGASAAEPAVPTSIA